MFHRVPFILPILYPGLVWRVPTEKKELFLTFDDGPVPGPTEFVLEVLQKYSCKATFFCIGDNVRKHPQLFKKVVEAGHLIGNHTFNHLKGWSTSNEEYINNVELFNSQLKLEHGGLNTNLFRPPYGRITRSQIKALQHYKIIMWDVLTADYKKSLSPESCLKNSIAATRKGSIVVFHDSLKAEKNLVYTLPRYIEYCLDQGYTFKLLSV